MINYMIYHGTSKHIESLLLLYIIAITGFGSFFTYGTSIFFISPILFFLFFYRKERIPKSVYFVVILYSLWSGLQAFVHDGSFNPVLTQSFRFYLLALCAAILRHNFLSAYTRIIYVLSFTSLVLWLMCLLPPIKEVLISIAEYFPELRPAEFLEKSTYDAYSIYIYLIPADDNIRNAGPFWEPGMFTVFITFALALNLFSGKKLFSRDNLVLIVTNITTFSTTGYIAMLFLIVSYIFVKNKNIITKLLSLLSMPIFLYWISSLDFMKDKIVREAGNTDLAYSRFGALYYHLEKIELSPIVGWGVNEWPQTLMDTIMSNNGAVSPNGLSFVFVFWGIPMGIMYFIYIYRSIYTISHFNKIYQICVFLIILVLVFSQDVTTRPFFFLLLILGVSHNWDAKKSKLAKKCLA